MVEGGCRGRRTDFSTLFRYPLDYRDDDGCLYRSRECFVVSIATILGKRKKQRLTEKFGLLRNRMAKGEKGRKGGSASSRSPIIKLTFLFYRRPPPEQPQHQEEAA